jgi:hypothetical protein
MTEMTLPVIPTKPLQSGSPAGTKLTGYERIKDTAKRFYAKKIQENPDFYAKEKERIKLYKFNRYQNDPEYAEKDRQAAKARYHARKQKLALAAQIPITA